MNTEEEEKKIQYQCQRHVHLRNIVFGVIKTHPFYFLAFFSLLLAIPVKDIIFPNKVGELYARIKSSAPFEKELIIIFILVIVIQIYWIASETIHWKLQPRIQNYVTHKILHHIFHVNTMHFNEQETAQIMTRMTKLPVHVYQFIYEIQFQILPSIVGLLAIFFYLAFVDLLVFLLYGCLMIISIALIFSSFHTCSQQAFTCDMNTVKLNSRLDDAMQNILTIISYSNSDKEKEEIEKQFKHYESVCNNTFYCVMRVKHRILPFIFMFLLASILQSYLRVKNGSMKMDQLISVIIMNFFIMNTVINFSNSMRNLTYRLGNIQNDMKIFDHCVFQRIPYNIPPRVSNGIHIQDLVFYRFDKNTKKIIPIFQNLNMSFPKKELIALVGPMGCGKSTILQLIINNITPLSGCIFYDGTPIQEKTLQIKEKTFYVPQHPIFFNNTVFYNLYYGMDKKYNEEQFHEKLNAIIHKFSLEAFFQTLPSGLDSHAGIHGTHLSGGQKQMLNLIKAFIDDPEILLLDEPTSSLQDSFKPKLLNMLTSFIQKPNKTVILTTHDPFMQNNIKLKMAINDV